MHAPPLFLDTFLQQCLSRPDETALEHNGTCWTYDQLNQASAWFAHEFQANGVGAGSVVAIACQRSLPCIAAMLGVLRSGAAFLPVDLTAPNTRIEFFYRDASVVHSVVDSDQLNRFDTLGLTQSAGVTEIGSLTDIDFIFTGDAAKRRDQSYRAPSPTDTAYLMYTSGSTGKPKGVVISHRALAQYCAADVEVYKLCESDRTLQFSTLSFDISIEEIFPPLCVGSTVVLRPTERSAAQIELSDYINTYGITALHIATGYWHEWVNLMHSTSAFVPKSLRLLVVTGEKVSVDHYYRWRAMEQHDVLWANAYGPTEATVSATVFIPNKSWRGTALPIGKPLPGYEAYILNASGQPVDNNETGELHIGGPALADGYLNRKDLTTNAFITHPFSQDSQARLYKTGDLARWREDEQIEYAGRTDHQVKIGSYRIEPGEIEDTLNRHEKITEAVVTTFEQNHKKQLIAYVGVGTSSVTIPDVHAYLVENLPPYMVPARYALLEQLPKTVNGKINRAVLADISEGQTPRLQPITEPTTPTEQTLHTIWSRTLGLGQLSIHDSFVGVGGDSLMAIEAILGIEQDLNFTVSTRDFFFLDTIALLAGHIDGKPVAQTLPPPITTFINYGNKQLYTVVQRPDDQKDNGRGILFASSLSNEQRRMQRPFKNLMQNFARQGYTVMRFDWSGTANSSGCASDIDSISEWSDDLHHAATHLSGYVESMDIVSIRLGALIASKTSFADLPINNHYYWDPVASGDEWLKQMHSLQHGILNDTFRFLKRRRIQSNTLSEYAGLQINQQLRESLEAVDFTQALSAKTDKHNQCVLLSQGGERSALAHTGLTGLSIHTVDEHNDWTNARTTTTDMVIHQCANLLADLLMERSGVATHSAKS